MILIIITFIHVQSFIKKCVFNVPKHLNGYVLHTYIQIQYSLRTCIFTPPSRIGNQFSLILDLDIFYLFITSSMIIFRRFYT